MHDCIAGMTMTALSCRCARIRAGIQLGCCHPARSGCIADVRHSSARHDIVNWFPVDTWRKLVNVKATYTSCVRLSERLAWTLRVCIRKQRAELDNRTTCCQGVIGSRTQANRSIACTQVDHGFLPGRSPRWCPVLVERVAGRSVGGGADGGSRWLHVQPYEADHG